MEGAGYRVRKARRAVDFTQEELAKRLGITYQTLSAYENGHQPIPSDTLQLISKELRVSPGWLLSGEEGGASIIREGAPVYEVERDFVLVPRYEVKAGAGAGQIVQSEQIVDYLAFKRGWVREGLKVDPANLVLITVVGDSMTPTLQPGDLVLIDRGVERVRDDTVYALAVDTGLIIKRVQRLVDGGLIIKSDNPAYSEQVLSIEQAEVVRVIGRLVWIGRRF